MFLHQVLNIINYVSSEVKNCPEEDVDTVHHYERVCWGRFAVQVTGDVFRSYISSLRCFILITTK